jgi:hypothetical protein
VRNGAYDSDGVARPPERPLPDDAERVEGNGSTRADAQDRAAVGEFLNGHGRDGSDCGVADVWVGHRDAQTDARRHSRRCGEQCEWIASRAFVADPELVQAELLGTMNRGHDRLSRRIGE